MSQNSKNTLQDSLQCIMLDTLNIKTHFELMMLLQGTFQKLIPHDVMIAAWGDFSIGVIYIDVVSALPSVRTGNIASKALNKVLVDLFNQWVDRNKLPFLLYSEKGIFDNYSFKNDPSANNLNKMKSGVVHGIKDFRGGHDCLYLFVCSSLMEPKVKDTIYQFLPYLDSALRQVEHLPEQLPGLAIEKIDNDDDIANTLSSREIEIMEWVRGGKTNQDIGIILNISAFTVKNHLQRIFKKLDVLNRAQAVSKFNGINNSQ